MSPSSLSVDPAQAQHPGRRDSQQDACGFSNRADEAFAALPFTQGASDDTRSLATSLTLPYCGANSGFEAAAWYWHFVDVVWLFLFAFVYVVFGGAAG
mgnify:CR=1 FL=1